jgi:hypothetical protein
VPITVFECKGIVATRRERVQAAVEAGGKHISAFPQRKTGATTSNEPKERDSAAGVVDFLLRGQ